MIPQPEIPGDFPDGRSVMMWVRSFRSKGVEGGGEGQGREGRVVDDPGGGYGCRSHS